MEPEKPYGGIHRYGQANVTRLGFIKSAQRLGFNLDELAVLLRLEDGAHCGKARELAERKLGDVRSKLEGLQRIESVLDHLVAQCCATSGEVHCPLIASLQLPD